MWRTVMPVVIFDDKIIRRCQEAVFPNIPTYVSTVQNHQRVKQYPSPVVLTRWLCDPAPAKWSQFPTSTLRLRPSTRLASELMTILRTYSFDRLRTYRQFSNRRWGTWRSRVPAARDNLIWISKNIRTEIRLTPALIDFYLS